MKLEKIFYGTKFLYKSVDPRKNGVIAIAASLRGGKMARNENPAHESEQDSESDPIDNSDFESIGSAESDISDISDIPKTTAEIPTPEMPETVPMTSAEAKIKIVLRTPKHEKLVFEIRPDADCSQSCKNEPKNDLFDFFFQE